MFLIDSAEFTSVPLADLSRIGKQVRRAGNTRLGSVFLKNADNVTRWRPGATTPIVRHGIGGSGKTIRKTPFALAGLGLAGYGAYRGKKEYDKHKDNIKTGMKLYGKYRDFQNRFGLGGS